MDNAKVAAMVEMVITLMTESTPKLSYAELFMVNALVSNTILADAILEQAKKQNG